MKLYLILFVILCPHFAVAQTIAEIKVESGKWEGIDTKLAEYPVFEFYLNSKGSLNLRSRNHMDGKIKSGEIISATYYSSGTSYSYNFIWEVERANDKPTYWRVVLSFPVGVGGGQNCLFALGRVTEDNLLPLIFECSVKEYYSFKNTIATKLNHNQNRVLRKALIGVRSAEIKENGDIEWFGDWSEQNLVYITNAKGDGEIYIFRNSPLFETESVDISYKKSGTHIKKYYTEDGDTYQEWELNEDEVVTLFEDSERGLFITTSKYSMLFHYY